MVFVNKIAENRVNSRTVDEERGASLRAGAKHLSGYPMIPSSAFTLEWKGEEIEFVVLTDIKFFNPDGSSMKISNDIEISKQQMAVPGTYAEKWYRIVQVKFPKHFLPFRSEMRELITEALDTYGINYGKMDNTRIMVVFDPRVKSLDPDFVMPENEVLPDEPPSSSFH